jgi:predicted nucleic acid-binding protein
MAALLTAGRRELSLVDCVSFACMRRLGITRALHFDRHFKEQGFAFAG